MVAQYDNKLGIFNGEQIKGKQLSSNHPTLTSTGSISLKKNQLNVIKFTQGLKSYKKTLTQQCYSTWKETAPEVYIPTN